MGRIGGGGFRRGGGHRNFGPGRRHGGGGMGRMGMRRRIGIRAGFHRTGFRARFRHRRMHRHTVFRSYFRGRRIRHFWRPYGYCVPMPFYLTPGFQAYAATMQITPQVQPRTLTVTVVPYAATTAVLPNVAPGSVFQFVHPGDSRTYLISAPHGAAPGLRVDLMLPPSDVRSTTDRVDVLVNLLARPGEATVPPSIDTTGDGVPDASPFVPGQDAFISVVASQGGAGQLFVYVPATSLLALKHIVDAVESWGELALARRMESNAAVAETVFSIDMVQLGAENVGLRWEHEHLLNQAIRTAPRVVSVAVPSSSTPGSIFTVPTSVSGAMEDLHVQVPDNVRPGETLEVGIPEESTIPVAQLQIPSETVGPDPNAWATPQGTDFYAQLEASAFSLTVGVLEVSILQVSIPQSRRVRIRWVTWLVLAILVLAIVITCSVIFDNGGDDATVPGYSTGELCSDYYQLSVECMGCPTYPTLPSGVTGNLTCWEDKDLTWEDMPSSWQDDWSSLGYTAASWSAGDSKAPASTNECFFDLSDTQRAAAEDLGFTAQWWDYPYVCP